MRWAFLALFRVQITRKRMEISKKTFFYNCLSIPRLKYHDWIICWVKIIIFLGEKLMSQFCSGSGRITNISVPNNRGWQITYPWWSFESFKTEGLSTRICYSFLEIRPKESKLLIIGSNKLFWHPKLLFLHNITPRIKFFLPPVSITPNFKKIILWKCQILEGLKNASIRSYCIAYYYYYKVLSVNIIKFRPRR